MHTEKLPAIVPVVLALVFMVSPMSVAAAAKPVNAVCGPSNGETFTSAPTSGLCTAGTAADIDSTSTGWTWFCLGLDGGKNVTCSAKHKPVNGVCGPANGETFTCVPTSGLCTSGTVTDVDITSTGWTWRCTGSYGGTTATCSASKKKCTQSQSNFDNCRCGD